MKRARMIIPLVIVTLGALFASITMNGPALSAFSDSDSKTQYRNNIEVLVAARAVSRAANSLAATGSIESNGKMTRESVLASRMSIENYKVKLRRQIELLEGMGYDDSVSRISEHADSLIANVDDIEQGRPDLLSAMLTGAQKRQKLGMTTPRELLPAIEDSLDDQFYYMVTGRSDSRDGITANTEADTRALTLVEFMRYYHLANLLGSAGSSQYSLLIAARLADPTLVTRLEESFDSSAHKMSRSIEYLAENGGPELNPKVIPLSQELIDAGSAQENYFDALKTRLEMAENERELIAANGRILESLQEEIDALVHDVEINHAASQNG